MTNKDPSSPERDEAAVRRAAADWHKVALRLRSMRPSTLAHAVMVAGAVSASVWLVQASWPALLPFVVGGAIAYLLLPVTNFLDRLMPRLLAALLTVAGFAVVLALVAYVVVVPLAQQLYRLFLALPTAEEVRALLDGLARYAATLPQPTQERIQGLLRQVADTGQANMAAVLQQLVGFGVGQLFDLVRSFGFVLGLLVIPAWLLTILNEQRSGVRALDRRLPPKLRADFWATVRIVDRSFRSFLHVQLVLGLAVGVTLYLALMLFARQGWLDLRYPTLVAIFCGLMMLIPSLGPFLGAIPSLLAMVAISVPDGLLSLGLYIAVVLVVNLLLGSHLQERLVRVHPAVLVVILVALGAIGPVWLLLSAPVTAAVVDLYLYAYGRLGEPPRPAGVLPGEPLPIPRNQAASARRRTPLVYRRGGRQANTPTR